jgi:hypothetical protein
LPSDFRQQDRLGIASHIAIITDDENIESTIFILAD